MNGQVSQTYNLANGNGFSMKEVIDTAQQVTGRSIAVQYVPRRAGDPTRLVADATLARQHLDWQPQYADLATIIRRVWAWEQRMVTGS